MYVEGEAGAIGLTAGDSSSHQATQEARLLSPMPCPWAKLWAGLPAVVPGQGMVMSVTSVRSGAEGQVWPPGAFSLTSSLQESIRGLWVNRLVSSFLLSYSEALESSRVKFHSRERKTTNKKKKSLSV